MFDKQTALYLFCFARPGLAADTLEGTGLEGAPHLPALGRCGIFGVDGQTPVFVHAFPAACAVLSEIDTDEFCGPTAAEQLRDVAWIAPRACRHEQVIERVMAASPVLPAPFATLFSSMGQLRDFMEQQAQTISRFLSLVTDKEEWAVRGLADMAMLRQTAVARETAARGAQLASSLPGSRYLQERRIQVEADKIVRDWLGEFCQEIVKELQPHAAAFTERQVWNAGEELKPVVNWAFLLPKNRVASFRSQLESTNRRLQPTGLSFTLSGPWPPYSFAPHLPTSL